MNKEVKKRKFHDSLLKMLYPPPPSPPREDHQRNLHSIDDDEEKNVSSSSSSDGDGDGDGDGGQQKLTRAQRKRLRKKKLRQAASQRRPIIGPLLPTPHNINNNNTLITETHHGPNGDETQTQPVRHNVAEESVCGIHNSEEQGASSNQNKVKQRRMAKKLTREDIKEKKDSLV